MPAPALVVAVPALDEAARIGVCLGSLAAQGVALEVRVSDNASVDGTADLARAVPGLDLEVRTIARLPPSAHFVSTGRWALATSAAPHIALLAGDDAWGPGFAAAALAELDRRPEVDVVFPAFRWEGGDAVRPLEPVAFLDPSGTRRRLRALALSDSRELANLVYGVYRRAAFSHLLEAWERGGDDFGADWAAAFAVLGAHRAAACPQAVGVRFERAGADLLARIGVQRPSGSPLRLAVAYVGLNVKVNRALSTAVGRAAVDGWRPGPAALQLLRAPQWVAGAARQAASLRR